MWLLLVCAVASAACTPADAPPRYEVVRLHGTPYERGKQYGTQLSSKIKSFYTTMLTTSLLPYFGREQTAIAAVLTNYDPAIDPKYGNGQFSTQLMRESAAELEKSIPQEFRDEMHGVADGAGMDYQDILVLNTFVDTTLAARSITYFLRQTESPKLARIQVAGPTLQTDGVDNDGNGKTDEAGEGVFDNYASNLHALLVELPLDVTLNLVLSDADGVDPASLRLGVDGTIYTLQNPELTLLPLTPAQAKTDLAVTLKIAWPAAKAVAIQVQVGDKVLVTQPPPSHAHGMRTEQMTFTTKGLGKLAREVTNRGVDDGQTQPPSMAFAGRGSATADGKPLLAHHFSLLDAGTSHKHTVVAFHSNDDGSSYVTVGWAGIIYGFSGMNSAGVSFAANHSDSLNNPLVGHFVDELTSAKLIENGVPVGFVGRMLLAKATNAREAADIVAAQKHTFGWNFLIADKSGDLRAVEVNSNIHSDFPPLPSLPAVIYTPDDKNPANLDSFGLRWASVGADDLRIGAHYRKLADDLQFQLLSFVVKPQRSWSSYYFPSVREFALLGDEISKRYGKLDVDVAMEILRTNGLYDAHDSMNATIYQPASLTFRVALGQVPATDGPFDAFSLGAQ